MNNKCKSVGRSSDYCLHIHSSLRDLMWQFQSRIKATGVKHLNALYGYFFVLKSYSQADMKSSFNVPKDCITNNPAKTQF